MRPLGRSSRRGYRVPHAHDRVAAGLERAGQGRHGRAFLQPPLDYPALIVREARRPAQRLAFGLRAAETSLGTLNQQAALELGDGVDDAHGQLAGRAREINAAQRQAQWTRTPSSASLATVLPTSITLRPRRSSLVTTSTSLGSSRSRRRVNPRRWEVATLPEMVSVTTRRGSTLKPAAAISWSWLSVVWPAVETRR